MGTFVQLAVNGLGKGAVYALLALGFVIIFKATEVVNFAHGLLALVGGYIIADHGRRAGLPARRGPRHRRRRARRAAHRTAARLAYTTPTLTRSPFTIGLDVVIVEDIFRRLGTTVPFLGAPWDARPVRVGDVAIFSTQLVAMAVGLVLITGFFLAFKYTNWGVAMRAQAENRGRGADGHPQRGDGDGGLVAGLLAGVAVMFIVTQDFWHRPSARTTHAIAFAAFPAAIIGGLDSTAGAVVGGIIVGVTQALCEVYISILFAKVAVFIVMLLVLVVKPSGLLGTRELTRV